VWLIGLAILFWKGWWWPGILVLVAISAVLEAVIPRAVPEAVAPELESSVVPEVVAPELDPKEKAVAQAPSPPVTPTAPEPQHRADLLPSKCPGCGAPVRGHEVEWTGPQSADCPYCGTRLPMQQA
jgi:hypothetical protein